MIQTISPGQPRFWTPLSPGGCKAVEAACRDLCGGCRVTGIPTATLVGKGEIGMKALSFFLAMSIFVLSQASCNTQEADLRGVKTPIWSKDVLEKQESAMLTYKTTIQVKPPFYNGAMPLTLTAGKKPMAMNEMINVYFDFGDFRNIFIYTDPTMLFSGIAEGAITTDRSGKLLAEARMVRLVSRESKQLQGIEIE